MISSAYELASEMDASRVSICDAADWPVWMADSRRIYLSPVDCRVSRASPVVVVFFCLDFGSAMALGLSSTQPGCDLYTAKAESGLWRQPHSLCLCRCNHAHAHL